MRIDKKASGSFRSRAETGMPGSSWEYQKTQNRCHVSGIGPARLLTILLRELRGEVLEKLPPRLEIARRTEQFGNIAHVWSIYESRHNEDDPEPFMRGINSIQLFNDGKRWWIVNIYWQQAFGSLFKELASTAEIISRSANRK